MPCNRADLSGGRSWAPGRGLSLSVSAAATLDERGSVNLTSYLDIVVVVVVAIPALALGAPALGYAVGAAAWIIARLVSALVEKRFEGVADLRRRLAIGVGYKLGRVWVLALVIIALGVTSSREDALTAAIVIFGAFSIYLACSALAHVSEKKGMAS